MTGRNIRLAYLGNEIGISVKPPNLHFKPTQKHPPNENTPIGVFHALLGLFDGKFDNKLRAFYD